MKTFVLACLLASALFVNKLNAQCTISNVTITPTNVNQTTCEVTFNLSYTADVNAGSKYAIAHLYEESKYPAVAYTSGQYPLTTAQTGAMLGTIIISDPGGTPLLNTAWPTGGSDFNVSTTPSTPILTGTFSYVPNVGGTRTYSFVGVKVTLTNCAISTKIIGDVWASQNARNASCLAPRAINVVANNPVMRGLMNCAAPRQFNVSFQTISSTNITFSAYKDADGNGIFSQADRDAGKLNISGGGIVGTTQDVMVTTAVNSSTPFGFYTFDQQTPGSRFSIFVVARVAGNNYDNVLLVENGCTLLPVNLTNFTAAKMSSGNSLKWTTASESNNKGFYIERFTNGTWDNIGFVATKAEGGNSGIELNYSFTDLISFNGVIQYRIMQVDANGKANYSQVRSIKMAGEESSLLVYPNPAKSNGILSIVLSDANAAYDIQVIDHTGRITKEIKSVKGALQITNLSKGLYIVKVMQKESKQVLTQKFTVQ